MNNEPIHLCTDCYSNVWEQVCTKCISAYKIIIHSIIKSNASSVLGPVLDQAILGFWKHLLLLLLLLLLLERWSLVNGVLAFRCTYMGTFDGSFAEPGEHLPEFGAFT